MIQAEQTPLSLGVNYDADYKLHKDEDLVAMVNARVLNYDKGTSGSLQSIEGTVEVSNASVLPTGDHICVGAYQNNNKDRLYYFLKNSLGNHGIYYYDWFTKKHYRLIMNDNFTSGTALVFDQTKLITEVGEIGSYLVFSDYNGFLKYIDTRVLYTSGTTDLEGYQISVVPIKPTYRPQTELVSGATNPLFRGPVAFYYRFVLDNGQETLLSPVSDIITVRESLGVLSPYIANSYNVKIHLQQKIPNGVKRIEFIVYNIQTNAGGNTYGVFDTVDNTNDAFTDHNAGTTQIVVNYDFSEALTYVDPASFNAMFQVAPFEIQAFDVAGNRAFVSNYKDFLENDADPIEDGDVVITYQNPTSNVWAEPAWAPGAQHDAYLMFLDEYGRPSAPQKVGRIEIPHIDRNNAGPAFGQSQWLNYYNQPANVQFNIKSVTLAYTGLSSGKIPSWATHAVVLLSEDIDKSNYKTMIVPPSAISGPTDFSHGFPGFKLGGYNDLQELITGSHRSELTSKGAYPSFWAIDFAAIGVEENWVPDIGDHIRIRMYVGKETNQASTQASIYEDVWDLPVLKVTENIALVQAQRYSIAENYTIERIGQNSDSASTGPNAAAIYGIVITVYKPVAESTTRVLRQVHSLRRLNIASNTSVINGPEAVKTSDADGHQIKDNLGSLKEIPFRIFTVVPTTRDTTYNRYTNFGDRGFLYNSETAKDSFVQKEKPLAIMPSGPMLLDTQINQLNYFDPISEETLPTSLGRVQSLKLAQKQQEMGTVMLAIGYSDTCSVYIGETALIDATGKESLYKSDKLIGGISPLIGQHGCQHKGTIIRNGRNVYWWDNASAAYVQYDVNGLRAVSENKASSLFTLLANHARDNTYAVGGFDPEIKAAYLAIKDIAYTPPLMAGETWELLGTTVATSTEFGTGTSLPVSVTWAANKLTIGDVLRVELYANNSEDTYPGALRSVGGISTITLGSQEIDNDVFVPINQNPFIQSLSNSAQNAYVYHHYINNTSPTGVFVDLYTAVAQGFTLKVYRGRLSTRAFSYGGNSVYKYDTEGRVWNGYNTYCPEFMAAIRQVQVSFLKGKMYLHNSPQPTVYGQPLIASVTKYNKTPGAQGVVIPMSVAISSNKAPLRTNIETVNKPQNTYLLDTDYRDKETKYYATVKRDAAASIDRLSGKVLRDECLATQHVFEGEFKIQRFALNFKSKTGHII